MLQMFFSLLAVIVHGSDRGPHSVVLAQRHARARGDEVPARGATATGRQVVFQGVFEQAWCEVRGAGGGGMKQETPP
jgi:hypothetical protein